MSETAHDVFCDLLDTYSHQHTDDDYPIIEQSWWPAHRAEWLIRFDLAEQRDTQLALFTELLAEMVADWVKKQAVDAAGWISVEGRLPPDDAQIDIWVERMQRKDGIERSFNERGWYEPETEQWMLLDHGQVGRYCLPGEEKVTHWRPIAPPPANRQKIQRADVAGT